MSLLLGSALSSSSFASFRRTPRGSNRYGHGPNSFKGTNQISYIATIKIYVICIAFLRYKIFHTTATWTSRHINYPRNPCCAKFLNHCLRHSCRPLLSPEVDFLSKMPFLLGCHGLPSLKMGFFLLGAMGYPVLKWGCFFFFFFSSGEKLQFLRNITCKRLNNDSAAVL